MSFFIWEKVTENHKDITRRLDGIQRACAGRSDSKIFLTALAMGLTEAEFLVKTSGFGAEPLADERYLAIFRERLLPAYQKWALARGKAQNPAAGRIPLPSGLAKAYWFKSTAAAPHLRVVNNCLPFDYDAQRMKQGAAGVEFFAPSDKRIFLARPAPLPPAPPTPLPPVANLYELLVHNAFITVSLNFHDLAGEAAPMPPAEFQDRFQEVESTLPKLGITGDKLARHCSANGTFLVVHVERRRGKTGMVAIGDNKGGEYYLDFIDEDDDPREKISSLLMELCDASLQLMT